MPLPILHSKKWESLAFRSFRAMKVVPTLWCASDLFLVREEGLEPSHPYGHRHLKPARLPIPPLALVSSVRLTAHLTGSATFIFLLLFPLLNDTQRPLALDSVTR